ncbi:MAG TPA: aminotransferase class I/II-fold pyridoxal phosphate-dependent enzyme, partial [Candidatus Omnitrophota bacterium]|nr:aminotransferase class I/II-fold pyridoxal phosphate-dependent enzyme [Candidatus Omnitrophota bacterium]
YAIASEEVADILNRVREPFNVNSLAQAAAVAALKDQAYYRKRAKDFKEQRQWLADECVKLGVRIIPGVTNFVLIDLQGAASPVAQELLKKGVIVRDMTAWGLKNFIRVTIGTDAENQRFVKTFKTVLKK